MNRRRGFTVPEIPNVKEPIFRRRQKGLLLYMRNTNVFKRQWITDISFTYAKSRRNIIWKRTKLPTLWEMR